MHEAGIIHRYRRHKWGIFGRKLATSIAAETDIQLKAEELLKIAPGGTDRVHLFCCAHGNFQECCDIPWDDVVENQEQVLGSEFLPAVHLRCMNCIVQIEQVSLGWPIVGCLASAAISL